jgi:hypothetical protein
MHWFLAPIFAATLGLSEPDVADFRPIWRSDDALIAVDLSSRVAEGDLVHARYAHYFLREGAGLQRAAWLVEVRGVQLLCRDHMILFGDSVVYDGALTEIGRFRTPPNDWYDLKDEGVSGLRNAKLHETLCGLGGESSASAGFSDLRAGFRLISGR